MQDQTTTSQINKNQTLAQLQASALKPSPKEVLSFPLTIRNRKAVVFEDNVKAMSSLNNKGKFDILPHHGNFISLIKDYITIHKIDGSKQTISIQNGIIYVRKNDTNCYIDLLSAATEPQVPKQGTLPSQVDRTI